jgi:hypothetical protein
MLIDAARAEMAPLQRRLAADAGAPLCAEFGEIFLRAMLPERYGVARGRAFAVDGEPSCADGVLIFDALHRLPLGDLHPVELVYALSVAAEFLDLGELDRQLHAVEQFKRMRREKATAYDVTPVHHLRMFGARYAQLSDDQINPLLSYVFAMDAVDPDVIFDSLNDALRRDAPRAEHSPDAIFCLRGGWLIARQTRTGELAVPRSSFGKFGIYRVGDDVLTWVYLLLNTALSQIQLRAPDLLKHLQRLAKA